MSETLVTAHAAAPAAGPATPREAALSLVAAASTLGAGIAALSPGWNVIAHNEAFARLSGRPGQNLAGASLTAVIEAVDPATTEHWRTSRETDEGGVIALRAAGLLLHVGESAAGFRTVFLEPLPPRPDLGSDGEGEADPAYQDHLTGLGNRRRLTDVLQQWEAAPSSAGERALLMIDLDRFKQVNDTLGHAVGDRLLQRAAERIRATLRSDDRLLRLGGDEFVILQDSGPQPEASSAVAARIVEFLRRPFLIEGNQINVGASVGIATLAPGATATTHLMRHADLALYAAKGAGRGTTRHFDHDMETRATQRRELEIRLRRALSRREMSLVYQPQVDITCQVVNGFEALLRWSNEEVGPIGPHVFIPLAEELGEIHAIGEWVLRQACAEATSWHESLTVAVNVSAAQLDNPGFAALVGSILTTTGLAPHRLEIEITEGVMLAETEVAVSQLWAIRDLGVHIAMDDFGTGYSSLSHLNSFPFSAIKIDQSFVRGEVSERSRSLVDAIIALGSSLGLRTVVEGVETTEQLDRLCGKGPVDIQGYLVSRPMAAEAIDEFLLHHPPKPGATA